MSLLLSVKSLTHVLVTAEAKVITECCRK